MPPHRRRRRPHTRPPPPAGHLAARVASPPRAPRAASRTNGASEEHPEGAEAKGGPGKRRVTLAVAGRPSVLESPWPPPVTSGPRSLLACGNPVPHRPSVRAGVGTPCLAPAGRPTGGDPALRRPRILHHRRLLLTSICSFDGKPAAASRRREKKPRLVAPPPAKAVAGDPDPDPLRRPAAPGRDLTLR